MHRTEIKECTTEEGFEQIAALVHKWKSCTENEMASIGKVTTKRLMNLQLSVIQIIPGHQHQCTCGFSVHIGEREEFYATLTDAFELRNPRAFITNQLKSST